MPPTAEVFPGGVLRLSEVSRAEAGRYVCRGSNSVGEAEAVAVLVVRDPPQIRLEPGERLVMTEGESQTVTCLATGDPAPLIHWERRPSSSPILPPGQTRLRLETVRPEDQGTYLCRATNSAGTATTRLHLTVNPLASEEPGQTRGQPQQVPAGSNFDLHCVTGQEVPQEADIVWSRSDGESLAHRHRVIDGVLRIVNAQPEDSGEYTCEEGSW